VLPDAAFGLGVDQRALLTDNRTHFATKGSLKDWQSGIGVVAGEHSRMALSVSTAFAGTLLKLLNLEGGGLNLHGFSSAGKTTVVLAAASVWGGSDFVSNWAGTAAGKEGLALAHSDTVLVIDEIGVAESREAAITIYQLAAGVTKDRARPDGTFRTSEQWRVMILSTGELPLSQKLAENGQRAHAGQLIRLLDLPADAGKGHGVFDGPGSFANAFELANHINGQAKSAFGTAGPEFIRLLLAYPGGLDAVRKFVKADVARFVGAYSPPGADGQVKRALARLGLIAAAGRLATIFGILPWGENTAAEAAAVAFHDWLAQRGGVGASEIRTAIAQVRLFIENHGDARFEEDGSGRTVNNRAGWKTGEGDDRKWLILQETWKTEICAGLDYKGTATLLADREMLQRDSEGNLTRPERTPYGSKRVYVLTAAILDESKDDF
jgi:uncharacterized protein (DUF927 family)